MAIWYDPIFIFQRNGKYERCMVSEMLNRAEEKGTVSPEDDLLARDVSAAVYLGELSRHSQRAIVDLRVHIIV